MDWWRGQAGNHLTRRGVEDRLNGHLTRRCGLHGHECKRSWRVFLLSRLLDPCIQPSQFLFVIVYRINLPTLQVEETVPNSMGWSFLVETRYVGLLFGGKQLSVFIGITIA